MKVPVTTLGDQVTDFNLDTYGGANPNTYGVGTGGGWFGQLLTGLTQAGTGIANTLARTYATRNAIPQLRDGQSITQLRDGTYQITQQPVGYPATGGSLGLTSAGGIGTGTVLLGAAAVIAVLIMQKGR